MSERQKTRKLCCAEKQATRIRDLGIGDFTISRKFSFFPRERSKRWAKSSWLAVPFCGAYDTFLLIVICKYFHFCHDRCDFAFVCSIVFELSLPGRYVVKLYINNPLASFTQWNYHGLDFRRRIDKNLKFIWYRRTSSLNKPLDKIVLGSDIRRCCQSKEREISKSFWNQRCVELRDEFLECKYRRRELCTKYKIL